jgi:hypothetical protein
MSLKRFGFATLSLFFVLNACGNKKGTPEEVVRTFLRATLYGNTAEIVGLLAPESLEKLERLASRATAQAGSNKTYTPADMLAPGMDPPRTPWRQVQEIQVAGDNAQVKLSSVEGKNHQILNLRKTAKGWRIILWENL